MENVEFKFLYRHVHKENTVEPNHNHPCYEMVYYIRGEGKCIIDKQEYAYHSGTIAFIPISKKHSEFHETETEVLFFAFDWSERELGLKQGVYNDVDGNLLSFFLGIEKEINEMKPLFRRIVNVKIENLLLELYRPYVLHRDGALINECMDFAKNYIQMHLQQEINLQELAVAVGYSYDYFRHQFLKYVGESPKEYILKERIERSKKRLIQTEDSIAMIAKRYNFESSSYFARIFKKLVGCTPTEYRNEFQEHPNQIKVEYEEDKKNKTT